MFDQVAAVVVRRCDCGGVGADRGASGRTGDACTDVRATMTYYTTDAPEFRAVVAEMEQGYQGTAEPGKLEADRVAYHKAFSNALRPTADEATTRELTVAITNLADAVGSGDPAASPEVMRLCPQQRSPPGSRSADRLRG
jgi:hypothetical protein